MGLIQEIVDHSGLPEDIIKHEIISYIKERGFDPNTVGIEEIRFILMEYLQKVLFGNNYEWNQSEL
ncbi:MAG: hypothetical protein KDD37_01110 [Bdellovibrionales bacterium]|nr:hypothetical protein [Bdellovibrionales bacterium]